MGTSSGTTSKTNASGQIARALHASLKTKPSRGEYERRSIVPKWGRKYRRPTEPAMTEGMTLQEWQRALDFFGLR